MDPKNNNALPPIYGVVLAGGKSSRMKEDKAAIRIGGLAQSERIFNLLKPHCERVFLSTRDALADQPGHHGFPQIRDSADSQGPISGIVSAMDRFPEVAWLVAACDLPFLDDGTLRKLLRERSPDQPATAFRSTHDGLPEPLCAIYEPRSRVAIQSLIEQGIRCPRKMLIRLGIPLLDLDNPRALDNMNTPEDYEQARAALDQA